jgi:hypothetical protein
VVVAQTIGTQVARRLAEMAAAAQEVKIIPPQPHREQSTLAVAVVAHLRLRLADRLAAAAPVSSFLNTQTPTPSAIPAAA